LLDEEHDHCEPDTPGSALLRSLRPLGPVTAAEALRLAPESPALQGMTPTKLGLGLRSIKRRGPINGMVLTSERGQSETQVVVYRRRPAA